MNILKNNEQSEKEKRRWTNEEKEKLLILYPHKTTKELCSILNKTEGQVRGMKERLGLNQKHKDFTKEEKQMIVEFYEKNTDDIDLDSFAKLIDRPKTSICRFAKSLGLTKNNRRMSAHAYENNRQGFMNYINSEYYKNNIYPKQVELLTYYAQNNHPQGMLGKFHTDETKQQMSNSHIEKFQKYVTRRKTQYCNESRRNKTEK